MAAFLKRAITYLKSVATQEPAVLAWFVNGGAAMLAAYAFHWDSTWEAALATIVSGIATIYTALAARPAAVPTAVGALVTIITAAGAFGFHPSAHLMAVITSVASVVLGLLFRQNLTPLVKIRRRQAAAAAKVSVAGQFPAVDLDALAAKIAVRLGAVGLK